MLRRSFLKGMGAFFIAPAIIRAENLMPIKEYAPAVPSWCPDGWLPLDGREINKKFYPDLYAMYKKCRYHMKLSDDQDGKTHTDYALQSYRIHRIISYKDLPRYNGSVMRAGASHDFFVPEVGEM